MPDELIALFDGQGQSIGAKERTAAYRDGDRVGLVFVWAAWRTSSGVARTLLQTRSRPGDPYLGSLRRASRWPHPSQGNGPPQRRTANSPKKSASP